MSTTHAPATRPSAWFAGAFGALLALALLKFGNPVILDRLITPPKDFWEFIFQPWQLRWGYGLLFVCVLVGMGCFRLHRQVPKAVLGAALVWLVWQGLSATRSVDAVLTNATLVHFAACVACFFLGAFCLGQTGQTLQPAAAAPAAAEPAERGRSRPSLPGVEVEWSVSNATKPFWLMLLLGFALVLWSGFDQHYGGLEATREMVYERPDWRTLPTEYLKKLQSNRIFSTLVYPNALAAAILLLLPAMLWTAWNAGSRLPRLARMVFVGLLAYTGLGCLVWSGSRSGWLIALALGLVALTRGNLSRRALVTIWAVVVIAGLAGFFVKNAGYFRRGAPSVSARFEYWKAALRTGAANPLLGTGPGTFSVAYRKIKPAGAEMAQLTHNDYLEQFSDSGVPGALAYAAFVLGSVVCLPLRRNIFGHVDLFVAWLGVLGWALQSFVEFLLYIPALSWTSFAVLGWLWANSAPNEAQKPLTG